MFFFVLSCVAVFIMGLRLVKLCRVLESVEFE